MKCKHVMACCWLDWALNPEAVIHFAFQTANNLCGSSNKGVPGRLVLVALLHATIRFSGNLVLSCCIYLFVLNLNLLHQLLPLRTKFTSR